jgi:PQQ-dependent dehydrogenase (methanol/ethanol family)
VLVVLGVFAAALSASGPRPPDWTALPGKDFPLVGGNYANLRHSTLTKINTTNIARLGGAWMVRAEGGQIGSWMQSTPVIVDGVMYITTGHIQARDARTGTLLWQFPKGEVTRGGGWSGSPNNHFTRGVVVARGKVFSAGFGTKLIALDQKTGELAWETLLLESDRSFANAAAVYYDGLVYMGVAGGEFGVRGQFGAYDADTGKEVWTFHTVPGPGEFGHDTWEGDSWKMGGAPIWSHPSIDPVLGMVYVTTGNAWPNGDGTRRGGDNLFSVSILALDLKTGVRRWHFQEVHHDLWDYDSPSPTVLADITYQGKPRKILMHAGKTGMMYILDRTNGTPLIGIEEREVPQQPEQKTAKTQPYPIGDSFIPTCPQSGAVPPGFKSGCVFTPFFTDTVAVAPGTNGGATWAPPSYSPKTKLVYVCGTIQSSGFSVKGSGGLGDQSPRTGTVTAMDPTTNKVVWQDTLPFMCGGGSGMLTTASGLLFTGQSDGFLVARDASTGKVLWKFQTGAGADAPVSTYEIDGEQYVAILAGGNQFQGSQFGDYLWAFKLGGQVPALPNPRAPGPVPLPTEVKVSPAVLEAYVGAYAGDHRTTLTFTLENGQLFGEGQNVPPSLARKFPVRAMSDTTFFVGSTYRLEFVKDASGAVTHVLLRTSAGAEIGRLGKK